MSGVEVMDDILQTIAAVRSNSGPYDGGTDRALDVIAEITDDITGRRAELCLLESRVGRLQRLNAELDARWLESEPVRPPISAGGTAGSVEPGAPIGMDRPIDIPTPPAARRHVAPTGPQAADDRAGRPPRRGIRAVFRRARLVQSAAQESPAPRTNS